MQERAQQLEALNRATRELMVAESYEAVARIGVEAAREILRLEANAIHLYDQAEDGLVPIAQTDVANDLIGEPPTLPRGDSIAWRVYEDGEAAAIDDVRTDPDIFNPETVVRSELYFPLDDYGILIATSSTPNAFDEDDETLGEVLAANVVAALKQVDQTQQLRERERELVRQNERLENFASIVSHDLRNPLNVASARLELLSEECESEHVEHIAKAHGRMETLIDNLLALARDGEVVTDREPVDLARVVTRSWDTTDTAGATIVTDVDRTIRGDETRLTQLFENLFRNAVEHGLTGDLMESDDSADPVDGRLTVTVGELEEGFYVADDGSGLPDTDREDVFDAGYSTQENGTGFGLSIVREIVDAHDWDITVTESEDGGARFEITGVDFIDE